MFSEMSKTPNDFAKKNDLEHKLAICNKHKTDFVAICFSCDELLCNECLEVGDHYSHSWSMLSDDIAKHCRQGIQDLAQQADLKGKATLDARESIPDRKEVLNQSTKNCRAKIEEAFLYYSHVLNEVKLDLLTELDRNRDEKEEYLDGLYQKIDMQTSKLQDALSYTSRLLEKGNVVELCLNKKKVWQQLKLLMHSMPDANAEVDLDFDALPRIDFKKKLESIVGGIKCRVTGIPKDAKNLNLLTTEPARIEGIGPALAEMKHSGHLTSSSIWDAAKVPQQSLASYQNPGTIGMERRMNRTSNGNGQSYLSGDSGNFSISDLTTLSSPISNNAVNGQNTPSMENFGLGRFGLDSFASFRTPSGFDMSGNTQIDIGDCANALFHENYLSGSQSKLWAPQYANSPSIFMHFDGTTGHQRPRDLMESHFTIGQFSAYDSNDPSGLRSRSSLCTTPSVEHFVSSVPPQHELIGLSSGRSHLGHNQQFGNLGTSRDMTLFKHFNADKNNAGDTFNTPQGICLGLDTEVAIADTNNHRCIVFNFNDGTLVRSIGSSGTEEGSVYYPKKVVSLIRGRDCLFIVLDRGANQLFNRLQLFKNNGEYISRLVPPSPCQIDQVTVMAMNKENEQLVIIDNKNVVYAFEFETFNQLRLVRHFSISGYVHEASDIAVDKGQYYITDYKTHCVVIYSLEGKQMGKFGGLNITPYPVGIDFSKSGDILVGDSHGNHYHVVVFNNTGHPLYHYKCHLQKVSRCTGLKINAEGKIITLSRQSSSVLVFNTLFVPMPTA